MWTQYAIYYYFYLSFLLAHLGAVLKDPGYLEVKKQKKVSSRNSQVAGGFTFCSKCRLLRPARAHHCRVCQKCVCKMDHHCPWICNCVGQGNMKYFLLFLLYLAIFNFYCIFLLIFYYSAGFLNDRIDTMHQWDK
ncbi:Palmitoyltransferase [Cichlidogyrus casuarinus]|uniref:Palmitoyltransferase n=1 Tax=Cichlidogyrus casuarinus TaxID=1844966 RepID=A0ABD2QII7_9PLAT